MMSICVGILEEIISLEELLEGIAYVFTLSCKNPSRLHPNHQSLLVIRKDRKKHMMCEQGEYDMTDDDVH